MNSLRNKYDFCEVPTEVECQTTTGLDYSKTGEVVSCSLTKGLVCKNSNQPDGKCNYDYKIRFNCGDEIIPEINCFDSDDGKNYFTKGYGYDYKNYFPNNPLWDMCSNSDYLKEAICSPTSENIIYKSHFCQYGCFDGKCKKQTVFSWINNLFK